MKAIVVGGGIGGCTTAIALRHFGIDAEVYEAAPVLGEVGAGLWVAPNGMKVYDLLGLAAEVQAGGTAYTGHIGLGGADGELYQRIDCQKIRQRFGYYITAIHRAALHRILVQRAGPVTPGKRLERYEETEEGVTAVFADGSSAQGDLLVGADGIRSTVRRQMLGEIPFRQTGQTCWRLVADHGLGEEQSRSMLEMWGDEAGLRAAYGSLDEHRTYSYLTAAAEPETGDDPATLKEELHQLYRAFPALIHRLIDQTPTRQILRTDLFDFAPLSTWSRGRVVLVGDAAHATTPNLGQGACQAIESAYILSRSLARAETLFQAFARYARARRPKAHFITNTSWRIGWMTNARSAWTRSLRNAAMKYSPSLVNRLLHHRVYSFDP